MGDWSKYQKFDVVDFLTSEVACEAYIEATRKDGADEEELESAYRDVERARVVHNLPGPVAAVAV
jgi:DNA-binding phage protein